MANQDSGFIGAGGTLDVSVSTSMYHNITIGISGSGEVDISVTQVSETFTSMSGIGSMSVNGVIDISSGLIQMSGELTSNISQQILVNSYAVMYGFLTASINTYASVFCADINIEFTEQILESSSCSIGEESMELIRYRGDTYPVSAKLIKNGSPDVTGSTFKMSTQIGGGVIYTVDGIIENATMGIVNFPIDVLAIGTSGEGVYDIQGNDGIYDYTYEKGVFTLLEDVTV